MKSDNPSYDAFIQYRNDLHRLEKILGNLNGRLMTIDDDAVCDFLGIDVYEGDGTTITKHQRWSGSPYGIVKFGEGRCIVTQKYHDSYWCKYTMHRNGDDYVLTSKSCDGKGRPWQSRRTTPGFTLNAMEFYKVVAYANKLLPAVRGFHPDRAHVFA